MDENLNVSVSEEVAEPQENIEVNQENENLESIQVETTQESENTEEVAEPQAEVVKPVQTHEQNAQFARVRREAEQKARDSVIAEMGMEWNGQPIRTYQQYQDALKEQNLMQEAQKQGIDPQFYADFRNMQDELNSYKRNTILSQQESTLSNDPVLGEFYNDWKDEVHEMANQYNCDLDTAMTFLIRDRFGDILKKRSQKIQNETITKINTNSISSPGSLSSGGGQPSSNVWEMSDADFNKMVEKAARGELRRF